VARVRRLSPNSATLAVLIDVREIALFTVVVANLDRERIPRSPLNLPTLNTDRDFRMWRRMNQLDRQSIDLGCVDAPRFAQHR
jgi:hypothetical protein